MKENGVMTLEMGEDLSSMLMEIVILDSFKEEKLMGKEFING